MTFFRIFKVINHFSFFFLPSFLLSIFFFLLWRLFHHQHSAFTFTFILSTRNERTSSHFCAVQTLLARATPTHRFHLLSPARRFAFRCRHVGCTFSLSGTHIHTTFDRISERRMDASSWWPGQTTTALIFVLHVRSELRNIDRPRHHTHTHTPDSTSRCT